MAQCGRKKLLYEYHSDTVFKCFCAKAFSDEWDPRNMPDELASYSPLDQDHHWPRLPCCMLCFYERHLILISFKGYFETFLSYHNGLLLDIDVANAVLTHLIIAGAEVEDNIVFPLSFNNETANFNHKEKSLIGCYENNLSLVLDLSSKR